MFSWLFSNRSKSAAVSPELATRELAMRELAIRASISGKLRNYNVAEDTTVSEFSLADDEKGRMPAGKMTSVKNDDVWGQANPRETGKWKKEVRRRKNS